MRVTQNTVRRQFIIARVEIKINEDKNETHLLLRDALAFFSLGRFSSPSGLGRFFLRESASSFFLGGEARLLCLLSLALHSLNAAGFRFLLFLETRHTVFFFLLGQTSQAVFFFLLG